MKLYRYNKALVILTLVFINAIEISLVVYERELLLKVFLSAGVLINTVVCLSVYFEYFVVESDKLINVKLFGLIRHDIHWDKIGRIFYNVDNKLIKAIKIDYGNFWENSIIFNNSLIDYQDLAVNIYNKAKDNNGFSIDYRVLDDLKKFADSKKI
ncbi:hypothetical protein [Youngiibacter fragilis]|uniref:Uncharacterized protein n=1 Tax=Youngiibacter fragilis 232.1 TaxID=994573 RepID=V7IA47_9CLOT|nr:hypothetical protein [Youngiibacter fragilis]ETA82166.1 hypothetical protein T472_0202575 [Youngiibacter fragilis 232.1]